MSLTFYLYVLFLCLVFILSLWTILSLVSGPPGSIRNQTLFPLVTQSQAQPVIGWLLPQVLRHIYATASYRQDKLEVEGFAAGLVSQSLSWRPCLVVEDDSPRS